MTHFERLLELLVRFFYFGDEGFEAELLRGVISGPTRVRFPRDTA